MRNAFYASGFSILALTLCGAPLAPAGELDPPAGAVAPTMKDLDDVSPRQIIRNDFDTLTPIVISSSGSYYLGEDIFALHSQHGIEITASDVTLDLNGFRVQGNTEVGSLDGIVVTETETNIVIKNGSVAAFIDCVDLGNASDCRVVGLRIATANSQGIRVGTDSVVSDCRVDTAVLGGILVDSGCVVERCVVNNVTQAAYSAFGPAIFRECSARGGVGDGFVVASGTRLESCLSENAGGDGFILGLNTSASHCVARSAGAQGFDVGSDSALYSCVAEDNSGDGFFAQFGQVTFNRCVSGDSNGVGFNVGVESVLMECTARESSGEGILGDDRTQVIRCVAIENGPSGIRLFGSDGLIKGCVVSGSSGFGINIQGSGNVIVGNVVTSGDGYNIGGGNTAGNLQANPSIAGPWDNLDL